MQRGQDYRIDPVASELPTGGCEDGETMGDEAEEGKEAEEGEVRAATGMEAVEATEDQEKVYPTVVLCTHR